MFRWLLVLAIGFVSAGPVVRAQEAQQDECAEAVLQAVQTVDEACAEVGRNQVCYGYTQVEADFAAGVTARFQNPGDLAQVIQLRRLQTYPFDATTGDWGIALLKVQANLPDTLPGQNVVVLVMGDASLSPAEGAPAQAFYFKPGIGTGGCNSAPDTLVIQSPGGSRVRLSINDVEVQLASTLVLQAANDQQLDFLVASGQGQITAQGRAQAVMAGEMTSVRVNSDGLADGPPAEAQGFDPAWLQAVPLSLLPEAITVSSAAPWTDTGTRLSAGQRYVVQASGLVMTCDDLAFAFCAEWSPPAGKTQPTDCTLDGCLVYGAPFGVLVGRIDGGQPFVVGAGGAFVAARDGRLELGINDAGWGDNAGAFYALVSVVEGR